MAQSYEYSWRAESLKDCARDSCFISFRLGLGLSVLAFPTKFCYATKSETENDIPPTTAKQILSGAIETINLSIIWFICHAFVQINCIFLVD